MSDAHVDDATDAALDPLDAELISLIAEHRLDEILANLPCGNTMISAGDITLCFESSEEDEVPESPG